MNALPFLAGTGHAYLKQLIGLIYETRISAKGILSLQIGRKLRQMSCFCLRQCHVGDSLVTPCPRSHASLPTPRAFICVGCGRLLFVCLCRRFYLTFGGCTFSLSVYRLHWRFFPPSIIRCLCAF